MPWRLFGLIVVVGILLAFIGFNLDNTCDISFGFVSVAGVPVFLTIFVSFMLGMLCTLPFILFKALQKKPKQEKSGKSPKKEESSGANAGGGPYGID
ncbi:MAG: hypothetical protein LBO65_01525 [Spirochaetaceae bacterium]|jgi:uncharacterized integral membrane protein|nr:hypothetical protein [Spirochaetaceae bacterium]